MIDEEVATLLREGETIDGTAVADILGRIPANRGEPAGATAST